MTVKKENTASELEKKYFCVLKPRETESKNIKQTCELIVVEMVSVINRYHHYTELKTTQEIITKTTVENLILIFVNISYIS